MEHVELVSWLREGDPDRLQWLWDRADAVRRQHVGDAVHLRGLIEFSNHCVRRCAYCGLHAANRGLVRYRMTEEEIVECAREAAQFGYGTVVLQSGEDLGVAAGWVSGVVRHIKSDTGLAVTLSLGERGVEELEAWHAAGADRYLLRFETSNVELFQRLHPPRPGQRWPDRIALLRQLRRIGYEVGSGVMNGIPGQTYNDLARDIGLFAELNLDMVGVGPYLPHPDTPLADANQTPSVPREDQAPGSELMTYKVIALTRLTCPRTNIPATTALATLNRANGREWGLQRGANVIMPNLTPIKYRELYEIYPDKACVGETADACRACLESRIRGIGRHIGTGRGDSPHFHDGASSEKP